VIALAAATVAVTDGNERAYGDVNSDGQIDVLDLQVVIADVLDGGTPASAADVNGDGCIDVRDFQLALSKAHQSHEDDDPPPSDDVYGLPQVSNKTLRLARLDWREDIAAILACQHTSATPHECSCPLVRPTRSQRYLFQLTPHAPPACA